jgi:hypothetical protein
VKRSAKRQRQLDRRAALPPLVQLVVKKHRELRRASMEREAWYKQLIRQLTEQRPPASSEGQSHVTGVED